MTGNYSTSHPSAPYLSATHLTEEGTGLKEILQSHRARNASADISIPAVPPWGAGGHTTKGRGAQFQTAEMVSSACS